MTNSAPLRVLWLTERSPRHQQRALDIAPAELDITILRQPTPEILMPYLPHAEILISERRGMIDANLLDQMPALRFILRLGASAHDIDLFTTHERNIPVSRQPDLGNILVAEHCLMMMLALSKRLNSAQSAAQSQAGQQSPQRTDENTFAYNWARVDRVLSLYGKTLAIVGMGDIGIELARRLQPFLLNKILYNKRTQLPKSTEQSLGLHYANRPECYQHADIIVSLLPYTPETDHLIDAAAFAQMKQGAFFVQAGSGRTIDENALAEAVQKGHFGGVAFDTFEYEPLQANHPLLQLAQNPELNIILTPHVAAGTTAHIQNRGYEYAEILRFIRGEPLQLRIDG